MNEYFLFAIALIPIIFLIVMLGVLNKPAHISTLLGVAITSVLAIFFFKSTLLEVSSAIVEGILYGLWPIMITIIGALFTYNLALHTKKMDVIKTMLAGISSDPRIQVLIIAWAFGGFLEGVAGYGTAVALPASLLAVLGFNPLFAAILCLIANTVPTAFGAVGIPVSTLAEVTGLGVTQLSYTIVVQTFIFMIIIPFILVILTGKGFKGLKGVVGITLVSGLAFALPQLYISKALGAELPSVFGGLISLAATIGVALLFYKNKEAKRKEDQVTFKEAVMAWLPYILILIFILVTSPVVPFIHEPLTHIKTSLKIYQGPNAAVTSFKWLLTPGVLIIIATVIAGFIQGCSLGVMASIFVKTCKKMTLSIITVLAIVSIAKIMDYSGMIQAIAVVLVSVTGTFFPIISPFLGALGTFITGSDTSANLLFGSLQTSVAKQIGVSDYWLAAANTSGATLGKMISPQSIAIAASATNLVGQEGTLLSKTVKYCIGFVIVLGIIIYVGGKFIPIA
ncbi:MAG TPA: lactate permease [Firmicutes bacterium]|nr:lactate permease [Bacillota bacterium]